MFLKHCSKCKMFLLWWYFHFIHFRGSTCNCWFSMLGKQKSWLCWSRQRMCPYSHVTLFIFSGQIFLGEMSLTSCRSNMTIKMTDSQQKHVIQVVFSMALIQLRTPLIGLYVKLTCSIDCSSSLHCFVSNLFSLPLKVERRREISVCLWINGHSCAESIRPTR